MDELFPLRDALEVRPRGGLSNTYAKLEERKPFTIAYLGGSITEQDGWRTLSLDWFRQLFPLAEIRGIHAAIGGTGSEIGVFRLEQDVLAEKPDLVFVEFAVNDTQSPTQTIIRAMEGIVRKIWLQNPMCDISFAYTVTEKSLPFAQNRQCTRPMSSMEMVADYYQIPSIHLGLEIAQLEHDGKLIMAAGHLTRLAGDELNQLTTIPSDDGTIVFSPDGAHPYLDTGHVLYLRAFTRAMTHMQTLDGKAASHHLPPPIDSRNYEHARMIPLAEFGIRDDAEVMVHPTPEIGANFMHRIAELWKYSPGRTLSFRFRGRKAMLYDVIGPGCGMVEVMVDGYSRKVLRIDQYGAFYRLSALPVFESPVDEEHTVQIRVLSDMPDKSSILSNKDDINETPGKYAACDWYCAALFCVGEVLK